MNDAIKMQLSAFVDGELSEAEAGLLIRRLSRDPELRELVAEYQSIGRAMRAEDSLPGTENLLGRIHVALGDEVEAPTETVAEIEKAPASMRPMLGMAAAVAVAVLGIFSVSQIETVQGPAVADSYTVPDAVAEGYVERHLQSADKLNALMASFETDDASLNDVTDDDPAEEEESEEMPAEE